MKINKSATIRDVALGQLIRVAVELAVKVVATPGISIRHRKPSSQAFEAAIAFGAALAFERYAAGGNQQGLEVTVFYIEHQHSGPKMAVVAMLAAQCSCEALGVSATEAPVLDDSQAWIRVPL